MCFFKSHQSKNTESILVTFFSPNRTTWASTQTPGGESAARWFFCFEAGFHRARLSVSNSDPDVNPAVRQSRSEELQLDTFAPSGCFSTVWTIIKPSCCCCSSDEPRGSDLLLDISVFMSRVCFDVCLMQVDAKWKTKRIFFFVVVNIIYSPVAALASPFRHVTEQRLKVHARCSATQVGFHIPDLHMWWWRLKERSDIVKTLGATQKLLDISNTSYTSTEMMLSNHSNLMG